MPWYKRRTTKVVSCVLATTFLLKFYTPFIHFSQIQILFYQSYQYQWICNGQILFQGNTFQLNSCSYIIINFLSLWCWVHLYMNLYANIYWLIMIDLLHKIYQEGFLKSNYRMTNLWRKCSWHTSPVSMLLLMRWKIGTSFN